ncbi:MAG TPA: thioredoxin [Burkholderiales bacterium]|nr:thioredoxin [Burkholderiales bacterium]
MDVTTPNFEKEVLEASKTLPVVVDFWAPWCSPCRALTPILEKVAKDYAGRVKVVKVNSDENPELSAAFQVRSIPNVIAFKDGRAASQFMGAIPEGQVRAFFDSLLPSPSELALARAEAHFKAGRLDESEKELANVKFDPDWEARVEALKQGIAYARAGKSGPGEAELKAKLAANPADHDSRAALAALYAGAKRWREAMEELLEILRRAKDWKDGAARKELVNLFTLAADQPDLVAEYRKKLAAALY